MTTPTVRLLTLPLAAASSSPIRPLPEAVHLDWWQMTAAERDETLLHLNVQAAALEGEATGEHDASSADMEG